MSSAIDELEAENSASRENIRRPVLADNAKEPDEDENAKSNGDLDAGRMKRFLSMRKQRAEPKYQKLRQEIDERNLEAKKLEQIFRTEVTSKSTKAFPGYKHLLATGIDFDDSQLRNILIGQEVLP